jgi:Ca-activated chloride channel family protein
VEPLFRLNQGRYYITAQHDDAQTAMEVTVAPGEQKQVTMNLNAGYLKLRAVLKQGAPPVTEQMYWHVYDAQTDINGNRKEITHSGHVEPLFRLNQGRYYITAQHDDAQTAMEITVAPGEQKQITLDFSKTQFR